MSELDLIYVRQQKHQKMNNGTYPLAMPGLKIQSVLDIKNLLEISNKIIPDSLDLSVLKEFHNNLNLDTFILSGRIFSFRKSGAIAFLGLKDQTGAIQLIALKKIYEKFSDLENLDVGDIVQIEGYICKSKTGEFSICLISLNLLTKCQKPLPEKWSGLSDIDTKYRNRYLDMIASDESKAIIMARSIILQSLRSHLDSRGFVEVETSTLNVVNSGANAKPFITHHNSLDQDMFLRVAPELSLKKLVVGGLDRVYEIGRCYRNEGLSTRHNPEFTMLEFYEAYSNFENLIQNTINLFLNINYAFERKCKANYFLSMCYFDRWSKERTFSLKKEDFKIITMEEAVNNAVEKAKINFIPTDDGRIKYIFQETSLQEALERQSKINLEFLNKEFSDIEFNSDNEGKMLSVAFEHIAEPFFIEDYRTEDNIFSCPVIITDHPKQISPLARAKNSNPTRCDRFELYIDGMEIANGFQELNDPVEQEARFKEQLESNKKDPMDLDINYIDALKYGLPPTCGMGAGIDRILQLFTCSKSIKDVIAFPAMKKI